MKMGIAAFQVNGHVHLLHRWGPSVSLDCRWWGRTRCGYEEHRFYCNVSDSMLPWSWSTEQLSDAATVAPDCVGTEGLLRKRCPGKGLVCRQKEEMMSSFKSHLIPEALSAPDLRNGPKRTRHLSNVSLFPIKSHMWGSRRRLYTG